MSPPYHGTDSTARLPESGTSLHQISFLGIFFFFEVFQLYTGPFQVKFVPFLKGSGTQKSRGLIQDRNVLHSLRPAAAVLNATTLWVFKRL